MLRTHIGRPSPDFEDDHAAHGNPFKAADVTPHQGRPRHPRRAVLGARRTRRRQLAPTPPIEASTAHAAWDRAVGIGHVVGRVAGGVVGDRARRLGRRTPRLRTRRLRRHPQGDPEGARRDVRQPSRPGVRIGRPERQQRNRARPCHPAVVQRPRRSLRPLRHPRARDGRIDGRHGQARRHPAHRRHVLRLLRLHEAVHPARRAVQGQGVLRVHPRFRRRRRGRPDPSADRTAGRAPGDPRSARDPARRRQRDDPRVGRRRAPRRAVGIDPEPPEHRR